MLTSGTRNKFGSQHGRGGASILFADNIPFLYQSTFACLKHTASFYPAPRFSSEFSTFPTRPEDVPAGPPTTAAPEPGQTGQRCPFLYGCSEPPLAEPAPSVHQRAEGPLQAGKKLGAAEEQRCSVTPLHPQEHFSWQIPSTVAALQRRGRPPHVLFHHKTFCRLPPSSGMGKTDSGGKMPAASGRGWPCSVAKADAFGEPQTWSLHPDGLWESSS